MIGKSALAACLVVCLGQTFTPSASLRAPGTAPADAAFVIETLAGGGSVGDGERADRARLSLPGGIAISPAGDVVIVDFGNHRLRQIDHRTRVIRTIAGTGEPGYAGDGGLAVRARLARPENAAFGPDGHLYIVDTHNHCVRQLDMKTGIIVTVAGDGQPGFRGDGGPAATARFFQPEGIAFDGAGNYYIGDTLNGRVRRIARSGTIMTVAGTGDIGTSPDGRPGGDVRFMRVARLAADRDGNVYIADSPSQRIQVLERRTGLIRTVAGTGHSGFAGDGGPATQASLSYPEGVALDRHGNLYFADLGNHRVRRIDGRTGIISTIAGSGQIGFCGDGAKALDACLWSPGRVALDHDSNVYVADILNQRVRRIDGATGIITTAAGSGNLGDGAQAADAVLAIPGDLAYTSGRLLVAEYGNRRVRAIDLATRVISTVAGGGTADGDAIPAQQAALGLPEGIAVHRSNLFVADSLRNVVWRVDLISGVIHRFAGSGEPGYTGDGGLPIHARLQSPGAVAVTEDGTVFISDFGNDRIRLVDPTGRTIRTLRGRVEDRVRFQEPVSSLFATGHTLYWLVSGSSDVYVFDVPTRQLQQLALARGAQSEDAPETWLTDIIAEGDIVFGTNTLAHQVLRMHRGTREVRVVAGSGRQGFAGDHGPPQSAALFRPGAVAAGPNGEVYIADTFNHRIRVVRATSPRP
jgi:DNA-binding beta-propeller fold protein YncE